MIGGVSSFICYTTYISRWCLLFFWCYLCDIIWRDTIYFSTSSVTTLSKVVSLCYDQGVESGLG